MLAIITIIVVIVITLSPNSGKNKERCSRRWSLPGTGASNVGRQRRAEGLFPPGHEAEAGAQL